MIEMLPQFVILVFSVIFHEVAHGWMALKRGDRTPLVAGRLTFNPIPHIDLFRTILLPLILVLMQSRILIGGAKPVPINPWNFKDPKRDMALVAASGPGSNLFLAVLFALLFRLFFQLFQGDMVFPKFMAYGVFINLVLAFFNLVPIPPLDGSRIVRLFLSDHQASQYDRLEPYGFFIVLGLLYLGLFGWIIWPIVYSLLLLLVGREGIFLLFMS